MWLHTLMKMRILLVLMAASALVAASGCVSKVGGGHTAGVPFGRDSVMGHYRRPVDQIAAAAKQVISENGILEKESTLHETNEVRTVEGRINQSYVGVRIEAVEPGLTAVTVQVRKSGVTDLDLAHEVEKQIAVKLATR
jgi:hypothetical protein